MPPPESFLADLHIHSRYSRACSRSLTPETIARWAQIKGLGVVSTGDITHPAWLSELEEALVEDGTGFLRLREDRAESAASSVPSACRSPVRFILSGEVSTIYKEGARTRKVHHLILVPDFASARRFSERLGALGTISSDGRPILGITSKHLLELVLALGNGSFLIPAHIWTPWFSLLGHQSGFDSVEECFGDLAPEIFALETGLSSDPPMNWRLSRLDRYALVSNSDAHSPGKLARECTVFETEKTFAALREALRTGAGFAGTCEFFPEEGKYHFDGHRACAVRLDPDQTRLADGKCPACGKPVTIGVMHRVLALADRPAGAPPPRGHAFERLIPLEEIIAEALDAGVGTRKVEQSYVELVGRFGPELQVLRTTPLEALRDAGRPVIAEAIGRMRRGEVSIAAGYDGEFGTIRIFDQDEREGAFVQLSFF
jgi:DNA helicase II / ATP-dependent DNA helicase PcrA